MTRCLLHLVVTAAMPLLMACSSSPTLSVEDYLEADLQSVQGPWRGIQSGASGNLLTLDFSLTQQANGQLQGTGTMRESSTAEPVAITVTGTFQRPALSLTFSGMVYEGRAVTATFRDDYVSVGGVFASMRLTAEGYEKTVPMLLQERR